MFKKGVILISLLTLFFLSSSVIMASEAIGIQYYGEGGTGGGTFYFYSEGELLKIFYKKDECEIKDWDKDGMFKNGAVWELTYHEEDRGLVMDEMSFTGKYNEAVRTADELVRLHYKELAAGDYEEAYKNLSPPWKDEQSYTSFVEGFENVTFSDYADSPPVHTIKIISHEPDLVTLIVDTYWLLEGERNYLKFEIVPVNNKWYIDRVTPVETSKELLEGPEGEKLAGISLGDRLESVLELLGEPEEKSEPLLWGADGLYHWDYIYKSKGIKIGFGDNSVFSVTISAPCKEGTARGVKIGDAESKVWENYVINQESNVNKEDPGPKTLLCGTVYYGIIFEIDGENKVEKITMGSFAE